ncbi:hypothetical protein [Achromobacter kerstersii]|uniref:hypothetical protein n=1 Tax=Achromobacter kerstersii TaxID=1353890 RepID=UPI0006C4BD7A|nr:hypothetical protein [Achromobacter kerstersii]CUJ74729.1 Uncharacterised protein [Achromobacter kerstersii]
MSNFPHKQFEGTLYTFAHLAPVRLQIPLNAAKTSFVDMEVEFGCHCFTEEFDPQKHRPDHRYTHKNELRAFNTQRHECSLQLPQLLQEMQHGMIYNADQSYTYAAHISLASSSGLQDYSIFFSLKKDNSVETPALKMFVKSAYLKPLVARPNAQKWRFVSLAGQISGAFPPKEKKPRPEKQKKKAP